MIKARVIGLALDAEDDSNNYVKIVMLDDYEREVCIPIPLEDAPTMARLVGSEVELTFWKVEMLAPPPIVLEDVIPGVSS